MRRRWLLASLSAASAALLPWTLGACGGGEFTSAGASGDASHAEAAADAADAGDEATGTPDASHAPALCTGQAFCAQANACVTACALDCGDERACIYCPVINPSTSGGVCVSKNPAGGLSCPTMPGYAPCPCATTVDCVGAQVCVNHFCRSCGEAGTDKQTCHEGGVCDARNAVCVTPAADAG